MDFLETVLKSKRRLLVTVVMLLILGFVLLGYLVTALPPSMVDLEVSEEVQEQSHALLDTFMRAVSWPGNPPYSVMMVTGVAGLFYFLKCRREAMFFMLTLISGVISWSLKILINRPGPTQDLVRIIEKARYQSFPSGHTLFYTVFFGFLILVMVNQKTLPTAVRTSVAVFSAAMIFLVGISRVYLGAHWLTDVLAGFMIGIVCLFALGHFYLSRQR
ncbi:undecaprenyl-diphosphatase [Dyadobacter soli]|uniref:Undecaprenyl-diphosphatase n=1 Tax=Dyadobacter soli TaxID=659014 RepID=A0A1G7MIX0_9BACT|nr:phosphatase PAP2 family protein [Dyadobacter soli]SDF61556.1 undecaprenyl-diphosphatase [Dyadobacter soli]